MKFKRGSLYLVGMDTYICIEANEKHALVVPTKIGYVLDQTKGNVMTTPPTELEFETRSIEGLVWDPKLPWANG